MLTFGVRGADGAPLIIELWKKNPQAIYLPARITVRATFAPAVSLPDPPGAVHAASSYYGGKPGGIGTATQETIRADGRTKPADLERIAGHVAGWQNVYYFGQVIACSREVVLRVLEIELIRRQVVQAITDLSSSGVLG